MGLSCRQLPLRGAGILVALLLALAVFAAPAGATPPGANGKIAFYRVINGVTVLGIYTINPDGTGETFVSGTGDNSATCTFLDCHSPGFDPAWSPDGTTIAFDRAEAAYHRNPPGCCQGGKIWSVPATGGADKPLVCEDFNYPLLNYQCLFAEIQPAFSPDGTQIAYASNECVGNYNTGTCTEGGSFSIWVMPSTGTGCTPPTADTPCGSEADLTGGLNPPPSLAPAWSPDGTQIAYEGPPANGAVWVMNADGSNQHQLVQAPAYNPDWSPDGQEIVYSDGFNLFIYRLSDGSATQVTFGGFSVQDDQPVFSPDSTEIAFERNDHSLGPSRFQICTVHVDGSNLQRVTNSLPADDFSPSWQRVRLGQPVAPATAAQAPCGPTAPAGKIVVSKVTAPNPDTSGATFEFTEGGGLSGSFELKNGESQTIADVPVGSGYSVTEAALSGWDQTGATCSHGTPADIAVSPGETVTCTFVNSQKGRIIVKKLTQPASDTTTFSFSAGGGLSPASFMLAGSGSRAFENVAPGSGYSLAETEPAGWKLKSASCSDGSPVGNIDLGPGETVTCTFTNAVVFVSGGGAFVIGDKNGAVGTSVTFWGAQWWKLNSLSGGTAPAAFKGFAKNPSTPSCGANWDTGPGNSPPPPPGPLPGYMGVIVASSIGQSGSTISGNTPHIVIVRTNAGYDANPGHAGTGTVVAAVC